MNNKKSVRLPKSVKPERYRIMLKPDLEKFVFSGQETIFLHLAKSVREITLHAEEIRIETAVYRTKNKVFGTPKVSYNAKSETVTFTFNKPLPTGAGELDLSFTGILNDKLRGFYRSKYFVGNTERHMATTQFEATDARRAFPCIDEPAAKAVFDVTLMVPAHLTTISNTIESAISEHEGGFKTVQFQPTPKMSTYLLAFIVGEFEFVEGKTKNGTLVRIFVTPGKKHQTKFALECGIKVLEFYEKYFAIRYPLPVLDMIAIPDFASGAMENWGAVTYRETALLVDPQHSSAANKQWVALVIAHELAHQWFGNLVTMEWWTHLWLNEGFASYIEYLAVDHLFPQWDMWTQFAYADLGVALHLDALSTTHPIEIPVHHPDEISEIFDEVSYQKGSSIIRMLAEYLGETNFRDGLRQYLKSHSFANAATEDLWKAFEKVSGKPVRAMMKNWTSTPGYPLVKILEKPKTLELTQKRFFSSSVSAQNYGRSQTWSIPLNFAGSKLKKTAKLLMDKRTIELKKPKSPWVKFNLNQSGFYRVDYPAQMLQKLQAPVANKQLRPIDRLSIISDAFALAEGGQLPTPQVLGLLKSYRKETDYTVWVEITSGLARLETLLYDQKYFEQYRTFAKKQLVPIAEKLTWTKKGAESHTTTLLRSLALYHAGSFGHAKTIERAKAAFKLYRQTGVKPKADLRGVIYNLAAEYGGIQEQDFLFQEYKKEHILEEQSRLGRALGKFKDRRLLKKSLEFAISKNVRFQDSPFLLASIFANPAGRLLAWRFLQKHWNLFLQRYGSGGLMLSRTVKPLSNLTEAAAAVEIKKFFKTHKAPGAARTIQQVVERILSNSAWLQKDKAAIGRWLEENAQS